MCGVRASKDIHPHAYSLAWRRGHLYVCSFSCTIATGRRHLMAKVKWYVKQQQQLWPLWNRLQYVQAFGTHSLRQDKLEGVGKRKKVESSLHTTYQLLPPIKTYVPGIGMNKLGSWHFYFCRGKSLLSIFIYAAPHHMWCFYCLNPAIFTRLSKFHGA